MNKILYLKPITFSDESKKYIDNYDLKNHKVWGDGSIEVKNIKKELKVHLKMQQFLKCVYCRETFSQTFDQSWDVEHILPQKEYPQFLFHPQNLALACKQCNHAKLDKDILRGGCGENVFEYPDNGKYYEIIHPFYDRYSNHLKVSKAGGKILYIPLTKKGLRTYKLCNLMRYAISEFINTDSDDVYLSNGSVCEGVVDKLKEFDSLEDAESMAKFSSFKQQDQQEIIQELLSVYEKVKTDFKN